MTLTKKSPDNPVQEMKTKTMPTHETTSTPLSAEQCADALSVVAAVAVSRGVAPDEALAFDTNSDTIAAVAAYASGVGRLFVSVRA